MIDTPPAVLAMYRRWLLARSGEERLKMGSEMFRRGRGARPPLAPRRRVCFFHGVQSRCAAIQGGRALSPNP